MKLKKILFLGSVLPRTALAFPVYSLVAAYLALPAYRKLNVVFGLGMVEMVCL